MATRRSLPVQHDVSGRRPTVDAIRKRLGGRASSDAELGRFVAFELRGGGETVGVVLFSNGDALDVWVGEGVVQRVSAARTRPVEDPPRALAGVSGDVRAFGALREGERVRFDAGAGAVQEATLVEKCRFGAILLREDGVLVGVGFRKVWASAASTDAAN